MQDWSNTLDFRQYTFVKPAPGVSSGPSIFLRWPTFSAT